MYGTLTAVFDGPGLVVSGLFLLSLVVLSTVVTINVGSAAERLSGLPGVKPTGGILSGLAVLVYPLLIVSLLAAGIVIAGDVVGDDNGDVGTDDEDSGDGLNETVGNETDVDGNESDSGEETNETDTDDGDGDDSEYVDPDDPGYDNIVVKVWPKGDEILAQHVDTATVTLYDSTGTQVDQFHIDGHGGAPFLGLQPDEEYTISVTNVEGNTYPPENKTVKPRETANNERFIIEPGYEFKPAESHKSVYIRDYIEFPEGGDAKSGGYYEFADNGDALQKHTNARRSIDGIDNRWIHLTYTDGETNRTFHNDQGEWEEDPQENLVHPRLTNDQRMARTDLTGLPPGMEFKGEKTLEGSGVAQEIDGVEDRIPQVNEAAAAHDGRTVHVYKFDAWGAGIDLRAYVDVETKHLVRLDYGYVPSGYDDPILYTVDYWDHNDVESVDEYSVEELES